MSKHNDLKSIKVVIKLKNIKGSEKNLEKLNRSLEDPESVKSIIAQVSKPTKVLFDGIKCNSGKEEDTDENIPLGFVRPRKGEIRRMRPGESSYGKLGEDRLVIYTAKEKRGRSRSPSESHSRRRSWSRERTRKRSRSLSRDRSRARSPVSVRSRGSPEKDCPVYLQSNIYHNQHNHQHHQHNQHIWMPNAPLVIYDPHIHGPYGNFMPRPGMMLPNVRPMIFPHPYPRYPIYNNRRKVSPQNSNKESEKA